MRRLLAVLPLALFAACSFFPHPLEKPKVDVTGVAITEVSFSGLSGHVDMNVLNPNAVSLPLSAVDWQLAIGGSRAVSGRVDLSANIPAKGSAPVEASLRVGASDAVAVAPKLAAGERAYHLHVVLHFDTSIGDLSVAVDSDGSLG